MIKSEAVMSKTLLMSAFRRYSCCLPEKKQKWNMKIRTITCHDVYNAGASLQAFALQKYLSGLGHDVEIIDYKPEYLSRHYSLSAVNNPAYRKPGLRELYILAKLPKRLKRLKNPKKINFDRFRKEYMKLTKRRYRSFRELRQHCPEADLYIAGSDQIWNPLFPNGKDPAFFLDFVPKDKVKASYAASFAVNEIEDEERIRVEDYLRKFDCISVREQSSLKLLEKMKVPGTHVCDPVFLLSAQEWKSMTVPFMEQRDYLFVYDFDGNRAVQDQIREYAKEKDMEIVSAFPFEGGRYLNDLGPCEFLGVMADAKMVVSNSFHATAFSILFHIPFAVFERQENINIRMTDLLGYFGLEHTSFIDGNCPMKEPEFEWDEIDRRREELTVHSKDYLRQCIEKANRK